MIRDEHFRKLENMYNRLQMSADLKTTLQIEKGTAEVRMPIQENQKHAANALHGMYYFKVLDDSTFFAANSMVEDVFVLTSQFNLHFLRPVVDGFIIAKGTVVHFGKTQIIADGSVFTDNGVLIARGTGTFLRSRINLNAEIGYE